MKDRHAVHDDATYTNENGIWQHGYWSRRRLESSTGKIHGVPVESLHVEATRVVGHHEV